MVTQSVKLKQIVRPPLIALVVIVIAVIAVVAVFATTDRTASNVSTPPFESNTQQVSGVTVTNYMPILTDGVDWLGLSEGDRAQTARYAVEQAIEQAATAGVVNFNVMGLSADDRQPIFLYTGGEAVTLFVDGEPVKVTLAD